MSKVLQLSVWVQKAALRLTCTFKGESPNLGLGGVPLRKFGSGPRRSDSPRRELHNRGAASRNGGLLCRKLEMGRSWIFRFGYSRKAGLGTSFPSRTPKPAGRLRRESGATKRNRPANTPGAPERGPPGGSWGVGGGGVGGSRRALVGLGTRVRNTDLVFR